jgi:transcription initiation factor TFIIIB Brf1 subunit/transcription initiation factor TFIIB
LSRKQDSGEYQSGGAIHSAVVILSHKDISNREQLSLGHQKCSECGADVIVSQSGEQVCRACGLVDTSILPTAIGPKTRNFSSLGKRLHIVDSLGSDIGLSEEKYFRDAQGRTLPRGKQREFKKLSLYNWNVRTSTKGGDFKAMTLLNRVAVALSLNTNVRDRSAYYYRKATRGIRVKNRVITVAACLLIAARDFEGYAPVTLQELVSEFKERGHRVSARSLTREMPDIQSRLGVSVRVRKSEDYVNKIVSDVMAQPETQSRLSEWGVKVEAYSAGIVSLALSILRDLTCRGGRNPHVLAAATVYAASKQLAEKWNTKPILTQDMVSKATGIPEYTIRDHFCNMIKTQVFSGEPENLDTVPREQEHIARLVSLRE